MLYRTNLERMIELMRGAGAEVLLMTLSQNFADWAPGASAHRVDLSAGELDQWEMAVVAGDLAAERDCSTALSEYRKALDIDDQFADLHFRLARCERKLGRFDEARVHFRRASDLDRVPHGAPTRFNDIVREVAAQRGVRLADLDARLERESPGGLVGDDLFVDFVHPNLRGHQLAADEIARVMRESGIGAPRSAWDEQEFVDPTRAEMVAEDPAIELREELVRSFSCVLARRPDCAERHARAALAKDPANAEARRLIAAIERGDVR
jgi:tetratricopeptide (TPR) repeat protein